MENELSINIEEVRKQIEKIEDEGVDKIEEWKKRLDLLNSIKIKIHVNQIFSENEEFKEIKPEDLKFLLVSFYQAEQILKFMENREMMLGHALKFYDEYFKLLEKYDYLSKDRKNYYKKLIGEDDDEIETKSSSQGQAISLEDLSKERDNKILAFKYKKALSEKLKKLEKESECDNSREYWVAYIEFSWLKMIENIKMIKMELDSIRFINKQKKNGEYELQSHNNSLHKKMEILQIKSPEELNNLYKNDPNNKLLKNLKPIQNDSGNTSYDFYLTQYNHFDASSLDHIMSRQLNVRDQVFRPTNLPVMTLDEFAAKEIKRMDEQKQMEEEAKKNQPDENSDDENVADMKRLKERDWDDWKDLNEKGGGNKKKGR